MYIIGYGTVVRKELSLFFFAYLFVGINIYPYIVLVKLKISWRMIIKLKVMDTIKDIWFDANRIYMKTDGGETFSRPLEAFPLLKDASDRERP